MKINLEEIKKIYSQKLENSKANAICLPFYADLSRTEMQNMKKQFGRCFSHSSSRSRGVYLFRNGSIGVGWSNVASAGRVSVVPDAFLRSICLKVRINKELREVVLI